MADTAQIPELERQTFFPGQRLGAADLTELLRRHREMRWLHNRALHGWGIGLGMGVRGERGDTAVTVEAGYAVDCLGREILLTERRTIPVPAGAAGGGEAVYFLVAKYLDDADQKVAERRPGVCAPAGTVRLAEEPALDWREASSPEEDYGVVLAQAWIANCQLNRPVSLAARRSVRGLQQPYVAAGQTPVGETEWETWEVGDPPVPVGVLTHVDTSQARFRTTPRYTAHLVGQRHTITVTIEILLALAFPSIAESTPRTFTFQVLLPDLKLGGINDWFHRAPQRSAARLNSFGWHVVWMGIEG